MFEQLTFLKFRGLFIFRFNIQYGRPYLSKKKREIIVSKVEENIALRFFILMYNLLRNRKHTSVEYSFLF